MLQIRALQKRRKLMERDLAFFFYFDWKNYRTILVQFSKFKFNVLNLSSMFKILVQWVESYYTILFTKIISLKLLFPFPNNEAEQKLVKY